MRATRCPRCIAAISARHQESCLYEAQFLSPSQGRARDEADFHDTRRGLRIPGPAASSLVRLVRMRCAFQTRVHTLSSRACYRSPGKLSHGVVPPTGELRRARGPWPCPSVGRAVRGRLEGVWMALAGTRGYDPLRCRLGTVRRLGIASFYWSPIRAMGTRCSSAVMSRIAPVREEDHPRGYNRPW